MTERKIRVLVAKPGLDGHERGAKVIDRKSTRLNSSHDQISYAVFCLKKKKKNNHRQFTDCAMRVAFCALPIAYADQTCSTTGRSLILLTFSIEDVTSSSHRTRLSAVR